MPDFDLAKYTLTYNVDGRGEFPMQDSSDVKQAKIYFDYWTWNGAGPYRLEFVGRDLNGNVLGRQWLTLYVKH